ncbi:MAG: prepilin-type N-terminal cleavage/methylation domain-containing protein [Candidatus Riflebacteria bacterium]|nr:prepilin-type N-terminal cleavage/methylation domain-containing protein [Candidatus Riflebacteria bacterium]
MNRQKISGLTMIEILVATVVLGLVAGPLFYLISMSNRVSNASVYELHAVNYAAEISDQLQRMAVHFKDIRQVSGLDAAKLFSHADVVKQIGPAGPKEEFLVKFPQLTNSSYRFLLSPLDPAFVRREIKLEDISLDAGSGQKILKSPAARFWSANIFLGWKNAPSETIVQHASFSLILREES